MINIITPKNIISEPWYKIMNYDSVRKIIIVIVLSFQSLEQ